MEERSRTYYRRGDTLQGWERWNWDERGRNDSRLLDVEEPALNDLTGADLLDWTLVGQGSSKAALVELRGFEPLTPLTARHCLRRVELGCGGVRAGRGVRGRPARSGARRRGCHAVSRSRHPGRGSFAPGLLRLPLT